MLALLDGELIWVDWPSPRTSIPVFSMKTGVLTLYGAFAPGMKTVAQGAVPLVKLPVIVVRVDFAASWAAWIAGPLSLDDVDNP